MQANERGIVVAKDVLAHLKALKLTSGKYLNLTEKHLYLMELEGEVQQHVDKIQKHCEVCLLGACFLSKARVFDDLDMETFRGLEGNCDDEGIRESLQDVFDGRTLDLLEAAFEMRTFCWMKNADYGEVQAAVEFGKRFKSRRARVKAVMENVIANKGHLCPVQEEVKV